MIAALALAAALAAPPADAGAPAPLPLRRLALVAGANDGGPERVRLRYARADAERVAHVLQQLGGVAPEDTVLLLDPGEPELRAGLEAMRARVAQARSQARVELVLYYSGHSDEQGLLLRGARVPYADVRRWLEGVGADVRIAILDSCASGALTREKGGIRAPPFLVDTSTRVTGHAILTSSTAGEASQESDRIGASFFTYALVTGLRGAADASLDGRVTLSEAYQYAFQETLARTERTRSGPQHPAYDIQLVGSGDVVMTDLRGTAAALVLPAAAAGRFSVRDAAGQLVAEVRKVPGRPLELGLDPGEYRITRDDGGQLAEARIAVASKGRVELDPGTLAPVARERTARRGDGEELETIPVDLSIFPPLSTNGDRAAVNRFQLGLIGSRATRLEGLGIAPVLWAEEDVIGVHLAYIGSSVQGQVTGLQVSLVANVAGGLTGFQSTTGLNLLRGDGRGVQSSTFANWADGTVRGWQTSTGANYAGAVIGAQTAVVNVAREISGAQLGVVSVGDAISGAQVGIVNVGRDVGGAQIGLVNVARRAHGLQLGIVNVADEMDGAPVGLLSWARDGEHRLLFLGNEDGIASAELVLGSRWFHGVLTAGVQRSRVAGGARGWSGAGLGVHLPRGRWALDLDALAQSDLGSEGGAVLTTVRALVGYEVRSHLEVVAGPTGNLVVSRTDRPNGVGAGPGGDFSFGTSGSGRAWLGFAVGLRI